MSIRSTVFRNFHSSSHERNSYVIFDSGTNVLFFCVNYRKRMYNSYKPKTPNETIIRDGCVGTVLRISVRSEYSVLPLETATGTRELGFRPTSKAIFKHCYRVGNRSGQKLIKINIKRAIRFQKAWFVPAGGSSNAVSVMLRSTTTRSAWWWLVRGRVCTT